MLEMEQGYDMNETSMEKEKIQYTLNIDEKNDFKATEIKILNTSRPHMRAFHCSWFSYFMAFVIWFSIAPLLPEMKKSLSLDKQSIWTSNILSVASTIVMRVVVGPACDKYGSRIIISTVLIYAAIPTACVGFVNSATGLIVLRTFIGVVGCIFVPCQYWTTQMFVKDVVGTANAITGGWGNLGGGVTQLIMGSVLFPLFKLSMSAEMAWRTVCLVPAIIAVITGITIYRISEDSPRGNYNDLKRNGTIQTTSAVVSFRRGLLNINTWILFIQYACCFGVELTMNNAAALYFVEEFHQTTESAASIASIFGFMNIFARGLGGFMSDKMNRKFGMRGRLLTQTFLLFAEGIMILIFNRTKSLGAAIATMVLFSVFVQACEGSSYGIVPYIDSKATGSISGIVGAGGNTGAALFSLGFRQLSYKKAFDLMAIIIVASSILSFFIYIEGQTSIFSRNYKSHQEEHKHDRSFMEKSKRSATTEITDDDLDIECNTDDSGSEAS